MGTRHRAVSMSFNGSSKDDQKKVQQSLSDLRAVYKDARYDWPQLVQGGVTPLELAIAFLDDTSVGLAHRKVEFDELCHHTSKAVRSAVVENHDTFNSSVGLYHMLLSLAKESNEDSAHIRNLIKTSQRDMRDRALYLKDLDNSSTKYSEMIEILDAMEYLHKIPDRIDKLIAEKKIHEVYDVIAEGYKTAAKYNLWTLSAMNATQNYLEMQSNNLYDMIVEELKTEIYLKNLSLLSHGKDLWSSLVQSNSPQIASLKSLLRELATLELYVYHSANLDIQEIADCFTESTRQFLDTQLPKLHEHYSKVHHSEVDYGILLEGTLNPATESLYYIYMLLSTASKLNRLESIMEILATTMQLELHGLINHTTEEIKLKHFVQLARINKMQALEKPSAYDKVSGQSFGDASVAVLQDLFGTFFIKCLVVLQKHKAVFEIVKLIHAGQNVSSRAVRTEEPSFYNFVSVWESMSKEVRAFVASYLFQESDTRPKGKIDHHSKLHQLMTSKRIFEFDNVSYDSEGTNSENLKLVLDEMFPGFSIGTKTSGSGSSDSSPYITSERYNTMVEVLVPANILNMRIILEFLLIFTAGTNQLFSDANSNSKTGTRTSAFQFFHDFMRNSFLKGLQNELDALLAGCMSGDALLLQTEVSKGLVEFNQATVLVSEGNLYRKLTNTSADRVYANAVQFKQLFVHACHTMNTSFAYRQEISDMVLGLLGKFSKAYDDYYTDLVACGGTHDAPEMRLGFSDNPPKQLLQINRWMRTPTLLQLSVGVLQNHDNLAECQRFLDVELDAMFYSEELREKVFAISKDDFMDDDWLTQVCNLLLTATWVLGWLPEMRKELNYSVYNSEGSGASQVEKLKFDWSFLENGRSTYAMSDRVVHEYLTLSLDKIGDFDRIVNTFARIRDNSLIALRYDIRLKALYHIGKSFLENFVLATEPADADQYIALYNKELYYVGTKIHDILSDQESVCVFLGLGSFVNQAFLRGSELIKITNRNGIKRILLNVLTLQQMLRSVLKHESDVDLTKAFKYFELFTESEHVFMQKLSENSERYTKEEMLNLLRLIYSEKLASANASSFNRTKFNDLSRKINEAFSSI